MSGAKRQWGMTPGEKRAVLFICFSFIIGGAYRIYHRHHLPAQIPVTDRDSIAVELIKRGAQSIGNAAKPSVADSLGLMGTIDINRASVSDFEELPGIGAVIARRIIEERMNRGGFKDLQELLQVKGIGPQRFGTIKSHLTCKPLEGGDQADTQIDN